MSNIKLVEVKDDGFHGKTFDYEGKHYGPTVQLDFN